MAPQAVPWPALPLIPLSRRVFLWRGGPSRPHADRPPPSIEPFPDYKKGDPKHGKRKRGRPRKLSKDSRDCLESKKSKHGKLCGEGPGAGGRGLFSCAGWLSQSSSAILAAARGQGWAVLQRRGN